MRSEPYADVDELATYMQWEFSPAEEATAQMLLWFMVSVIFNDYPDLDDRDPPIDPALPKLVSLELVSRKMLEIRAGGAVSVTDSQSDITHTEQYAQGPKPFAGLELDDWARGLLVPALPGQRAFGIRMSSYGKAR